MKDRVAVVTGASSGIGYATALAPAGAGVRVAAGARRADRLAELEKEIGEKDSIMVQEMDVTSRADCDLLVGSAVKRWGAVDILVNNAGVMPLSLAENVKVDEWDRMVDVNIKGVLYCTAAAIPHMIAKKSGHIVNVSSVAGRTVFRGGSVYCATKHAITAFSEGLRRELGPAHNIRVTCIEPGAVATELLYSITDESMDDFVQGSKNMYRLKPEDVANAILFAVKSPPHMTVNEILLRPTEQER
ncbi:MAG: SDR family oxidoreductase [Nitrososphaera sp.]